MCYTEKWVVCGAKMTRLVCLSQARHGQDDLGVDSCSLKRRVSWC
jgi:hypothetical protein